MWLKKLETITRGTSFSFHGSIDGYVRVIFFLAELALPLVHLSGSPDGSIDELSMKTAGKTSIDLRVSRIMMRLELILCSCRQDT